MSGKRELKPNGGTGRSNRKSGVTGPDRAQKLRTRVLIVLSILSVIAIVTCLAIRSWVRLPEIPGLPTGEDSSQNGEGLDFEGAELPDVAKSGRKEGIYTFLLVGQDTAGGGNTDTMLLITFDSKDKKVYGMSLPRDTMINSSHTGAGHRLNAVYNYNKGSDKSTQVEKGMSALKTEVSKLTGIVPDFYVVVQWEAVGKLVDAIGGVEYDVPFDMDYDDPTVGQDLHIHLKKGQQTLDGEAAMGLIRWRHNNDYSVQYSNGDLGRVETQQQFLKAVARECLTPDILLKAPSLAKIFMENVTTDLSLGNLLAFVQLATGMDADQDITFVTMPWTNANYPGVSMVLPKVSELLEILNDGFNPYLDDIQSSDLQVLVRNSDGSYSVTGGTLLDSSLARARSSGSSSTSGKTTSGGTSVQGEEQYPLEDPSEEPLPEEPSVQPEEGQTSGEGEGGTQTDPGGETSGSSTESGTESGGETQPPAETVPDVPAESGQTSEGGENEMTVSELPSWLNPSGEEPAA